MDSREVEDNASKTQLENLYSHLKEDKSTKQKTRVITSQNKQRRDDFIQILKAKEVTIIRVHFVMPKAAKPQAPKPANFNPGKTLIKKVKLSHGNESITITEFIVDVDADWLVQSDFLSPQLSNYLREFFRVKIKENKWEIDDQSKNDATERTFPPEDKQTDKTSNKQETLDKPSSKRGLEQPEKEEGEKNAPVSKKPKMVHRCSCQKGCTTQKCSCFASQKSCSNCKCKNCENKALE